MDYIVVVLTAIGTSDPLFDPENDPLETWAELDPERWEVRKAHVFADGRIELASAGHETEEIGLSYEPIPSLDEINADPQFRGRIATAEEFEAVWRRMGPEPR